MATRQPDQDAERQAIPWWLVLVGAALLVAVVLYAWGRGESQEPTRTAGATPTAAATEPATPSPSSTPAATELQTPAPTPAPTESPAAETEPPPPPEPADTEPADTGPTETEAAPTEPSAPPDEPTPGADPQGGTLVAGRQQILPGRTDALAGVDAGEQVTASGVTIQHVVGDETFWVGDSQADRVFVRLRLGGESPARVRRGERVDFEGVVTENPPNVERLFGVSASDGAEQLREQGKHIEVGALAVVDGG